MPSFLRALALSVLVAACSRAENAAPDTAERTAGSDGAPAAAADSVDPRLARADSARILGAATAPVWVIEVSDYQCPYCRQWHETVFPQLRREFVDAGRVRFAYVHFPLPSHQHSRLAAEAAMCAGAQGRFWEYHDGVFATQDRWSPLDDARPVFDSLATAAGLDVAAYRSCLEEGVMRGMVDADLDRMRDAQVNSTPTFFVGDQVLRGAQPIEAFRDAIARALGASGASDTAGAAAGAPGAR